jgi:Kef-type K+ transport system membrane component KefB
MIKNTNLINPKKHISLLQSLTFVKATAWIILGISSMFITFDLASNQSEEIWVSTVMRFGLAVAFILAGLIIQRDNNRNIYLLLVVVLVDVFVCIQKPIGIFDVLMLLFDVIIYWLIFKFLKNYKL